MQSIHQYVGGVIQRGAAWFRQGTWTVLDQGLFAGSNFLLNVLLARWLETEVYGTFVVAYSVFLLLTTIHSGLITEPLLVFGPGRYKRRFQMYMGVLLRGQLRFVSLSGLGLAVLAGIFYWLHSEALAMDFLVLALVHPGILFLWLMRSACYVRLKPIWAASGGLVYAVCIITGAYLLNHNSVLSVATALSLMAGANLVAGCWIAFWLKVRPFLRVDRRFRGVVFIRHLRYGRWATSAGVVHHLPEHIGYLVLPLLGGFAASGVLKALMNLTMPLAHTYAALSTLLVPVYVRMRKSVSFNRFALLATPVVIGINMIYWAVLGFFGEELMHMLYDGQYVEYAGLLWLVGAIPLRGGLGAVFRAALTALERPDRVFWAYSGSSVLALSLGIVLIVFYGLEGAILSALAQMVVEVGLLIYFFIQVRLRGQTRPQRVGKMVQSRFLPHLPSSGAVATKK